VAEPESRESSEQAAEKGLPELTTWIRVPVGQEGPSKNRELEVNQISAGQDWVAAPDSPSLVQVCSFQGRKEIARGCNGRTACGPGSRTPGR
jgi:hypothetical protein